MYQENTKVFWLASLRRRSLPNVVLILTRIYEKDWIPLNSSVIKAKGRILKRVFQEKKHTKFSEKTNIS